MHTPASRLVYCALLAGGICLLASMGVEAGGAQEFEPIIQVAAPVVPVIPAPVPPASHHIRYHNLIPGLLGKQGDAGKMGNGWRLDSDKTTETGPELSLGECIAIALERQPSIKAAKASLKTTEAGYQGLMNFGTVGTLVSPDLAIRKQQAQRGLAAASADYQKAHNEVVQDVTRLYYSAVYARQQQAIADDVVATLQQLVELIEKLLNSKIPPNELGGLNTGKLLVVKMGLREAQQLQLKARIGRKQAIAALCQVMAVDEATFPFQIKDKSLPLMLQQVEFTKDMVVTQALARRPELALAAAGVDVFRLEVYAQGKIPFKRVVPTFASGADLHSKEIPQAIRTAKEYRPGGILPEMPTQLVGSKYDRVNRACGFAQRAEAVFESAQSLIKLEAENSYYEFELANGRLMLAKEKLDFALDLRKSTRERAENIKEKDQIVQVEIVASKAQSDYIEAMYEYLLSLATLERVTAGGISPAFPGR
jgi:outer membrane protein TolC